MAIAEGEKDADTLTTLGFLAVTNPGGAGKWNSDFTQEQIAAKPPTRRPGDPLTSRMIDNAPPDPIRTRWIRARPVTQ